MRIPIWGVVLVAGAVGAGVAVGTLTGDRPAERSAPSTSMSPSASPSPSPAAPKTVGRDEFVALLWDGRLVVVSASTGRITRTVLEKATAPSPETNPYVTSYGVALSPDRRTVFMVVPAAVGDCAGSRIERVDLETGTRAPIGHGMRPDVSPDGTRLAYLASCGDDGIVVRNLRSGAERRIDHREADPGVPEPLILQEAVWHADGKRLWVVVSWENMDETRLLDPARDATTSDADTVPKRHGMFGLERRGAELVFLHFCCYAEDGENAFVARTADGVERELARVPSTEKVTAPEVGPDGDLLYVRGSRLYRARPNGTAPRDLGPSTALARDW